MDNVCVQLRPVGDKRGLYRLTSSVGSNSTYRDKGLAWSAVLQQGERYPAVLVIEYDHMDEIEALYAVKKGQCRNLNLIIFRQPNRRETA